MKIGVLTSSGQAYIIDAPGIRKGTPEYQLIEELERITGETQGNFNWQVLLKPFLIQVKSRTKLPCKEE